MADTKNTSLSDSTEPTAEQVEAAAGALYFEDCGAVVDDDYREDPEYDARFREYARVALRAALSVAPSAPTEDDREALIASLRYGAGQLGKQHPSYGCAGCSICTARNTMEEAADELEARRSPVPPSEDVAKLIEPIIREFAEAVEDFESIADSDQAPVVAEMIAAALAHHSAASPLIQEAAERAIIHTDAASVTLSVEDAQAHRATANLLHRLGAALAALRSGAAEPVPSAPTPDEDERDALVVEYEVAWSDFEALGEENRDLRWRDFLLDRLITAGYRSTPTPNVAALIEGLRVAMLGTEDGDFIDPNSEIPAGEMFRLASEYVAALRVVETVSTVEDVHALPIKTLIVSQKGERVAAWREDRDLYDGFDWVVNGDSEFRTSEELADLLPALVFRPTREEG